ncbi:corticotropin-releasing factor-binding protein-like [Liolophura sinensis]|uniref:corticotropin-releasing factor-binding protein-like n=1 Tax=Liolophura sinensis TaxID=3198878 RepID=UPI003159669D
MESFAGQYYYQSDGTSDGVCGLFLIGLSNQLVEIDFTEFQVDCASGGLLSIVDGWELNGQVFPGDIDHEDPLDERFRTFCGAHKPTKIYLSSQNVALIQFRLPRAGDGFRVTIRFPRNPQPCNVVSLYQDGYYTLKNYGHKKNCSVSIIYPEKIRLVNVDVGVTVSLPEVAFDMETGLTGKCGTNDYVELMDGNGLDTGRMKPRLIFCGADSVTHRDEMILGCQHSVVRLVSSGRFHNSVTFAYKIPSDEEMASISPDHC